MLVVIVDFVIKPEFVEAFRAEMVRNARASREREPGCRRFDVAYSEKDPTLVFLYELYDDAAAFAAHQREPHFKEFDAKTAPWVASKAARTFALADSGDLSP
jgi:(4S)-4-hydroxy-5-phosphonooxypentane-2,3-dione isomerase